MGSKKSKFSKKDYKNLVNVTKLSKSSIMQMKASYEKFCNNEKGINKEQFKELYCSLRTEPAKHLSKISDFIFNSFDNDNNGNLVKANDIKFFIFN